MIGRLGASGRVLTCVQSDITQTLKTTMVFTHGWARCLVTAQVGGAIMSVFYIQSVLPPQQDMWLQGVSTV